MTPLHKRGVFLYYGLVRKQLKDHISLRRWNILRRERADKRKLKPPEVPEGSPNIASLSYETKLCKTCGMELLPYWKKYEYENGVVWQMMNPTLYCDSVCAIYRHDFIHTHNTFDRL